MIKSKYKSIVSKLSKGISLSVANMSNLIKLLVGIFIENHLAEQHLVEISWLNDVATAPSIVVLTKYLLAKWFLTKCHRAIFDASYKVNFFGGIIYILVCDKLVHSTMRNIITHSLIFECKVEAWRVLFKFVILSI